MRRLLFLISCALALSVSMESVQARIKPASLFGSNMVLQRGVDLPVWGWADAGEKVTVTLLADGKEVQNLQTEADASGNWKLRLKPIKTGPHYTLRIAGSNQVEFTNVEAGEVWLCSGQSNMHWTFHKNHQILNNDAELNAANFPGIRFFTVEKKPYQEPQKDANGQWLVCTPANLAVGNENGMSALAYLFGRELHQKLKIPVGLINSSVGGTEIELWSPGGVLYNGMILPVAPYAIRGAIWYQGESNCIKLDGLKYADKQKAMIENWRKIWGEPNFPFYFVQLAPFDYQAFKKDFSPEELPKLWEAQVKSLSVPNTGMVVITDTVNDLKNIHPKDKQTVARRLASLALAKTYGERGVAYSGPMFKKADFKAERVVLHFDHAEGLRSRDGSELTWFTIAGADHKFVPAKAEIHGSTVEVFAPEISRPEAVRLGWNHGANPNLVNKAGLPASPFRTDSW